MPRKPCSGGVSPTALISPSMTPDSGWSSWYQTTPAITSASTYGTNTIVRSSPRPRIWRLSSSATARPSGSWIRIEANTMMKLCVTAPVKTSSLST